ncbi:MAG TPA: hypothetical protein VHT97_00705 [Acidimicrobiales bacterium]|nr:hypothetical protein [Acidimicrobiales bacterium]
MAFAGWLRQNSEHYLMIDAQRQIAEKYGRPPPPKPRGLAERFWLDAFAPVYRLLPWKVRRFTIQLMPGSHRQAWSRPAGRGVPAVGPLGPLPSQSKPAVQAAATSETSPETRGE